MYVQDAELKLRLQGCIDATSDPFSTEIWYHESCRKKYIKPIYEPVHTTSERNLQTVAEKDVEQNFINFVNEMVLNEEEPKSLKSLCKEYAEMLENFGFFKCVKSDRIKDLLINNFGEKIGFHSRIQSVQCTVKIEAKHTMRPF